MDTIAIDLIGNGGGVVSDSETLFRMLFPNEFPVFPKLRVVASTIFLVCQDGNPWVEYDSPDTLIPDFLENLEEVSETGLGSTRRIQTTIIRRGMIQITSLFSR